MEKEKPRKITWDWRSYFTKNYLEQGILDEAAGKLERFTCDPDGRWASGVTRNGFHMKVNGLPVTYSDCRTFDPWVVNRDFSYLYRPKRSDERFACSCSLGAKNGLCRHIAALLAHVERVRGPFRFEETEEEYLTWKKEQETERKRRKREEEREQKQSMEVPVSDFLEKFVENLPEDTYFCPMDVLQNARTNCYETEQAEDYFADNEEVSLDYTVKYGRENNQVLFGTANVDGHEVSLDMDQQRLVRVACSCGRARMKRSLYEWSPVPDEFVFCCHALVSYAALIRRIKAENPGDETDLNASRLLKLLAGHAEAEIPAEREREKSPVLVLTPRIVMGQKTGNPELSFQLGRIGEKNIVVRGLEKLVEAVEGETEYVLSRTVTLNFAEQTFTEETAPWYAFILSRVRNVRKINERIDHPFYYTRLLAVGANVPLEGSDLDVVYDLAEGSEILYQCAGKGSEVYVPVGPGRIKAQLQISPATEDGKKKNAVLLTGSIPRTLRGNQYQYVLDSTQFGRVSGEELEVLEPYRAIADDNGHFSCTIGQKKYAEFFYRILPALKASDYLVLDDQVGDPDPGMLPPEPEFTFYIDLEEDNVTCRAEVRYGDEIFIAGAGTEQKAAALLRDMDQETRVSRAVLHFFPEIDEGLQLYMAPARDENLIVILTDGVRVLSEYGEVKGSEAFQAVHVRPAPQPRFSVQIEGGLLDLSIQTEDMSEEELLELLGGYRRRRRWHRLKNGDFVDLRDAEGLRELDEMAAALDISPEQLAMGEVQLPKYRALYVDKLLEEHDEIAASRNRNFKALLRSFRTIRDSDFEADAGVANIMRPYQLYGFRWLCTLSQSGFGGILADEMGLGKTLQLLAYTDTMRRTGEEKPTLVVCPASLVYNWKEECVRFTPQLPVEILAGTLSERRSLYRKMETDRSGTLYVTSYDLLKRDIANYEKTQFAAVVLDEAQYIKNQKAAVTKAVKILKAEHRYALTGTPIENRLSELWSIFDFLMPGFLYTAAEFGSRFDGPITKRKDPDAILQLSRMTEPFILRRKKTDVLKDLPDKLEEVQSFAMETDQRRLYDAQVVHMREILDSYGASGEEKLRVLAEITRLRQICCDPSLLFEDYHGSSAKREACLDLIQRAIDGGHRMLVFSQFTSMLALLEKDLESEKIPFYIITGSTPKQERIRLVNAFNGGDVPVFLISLKAGGTGLNLTGADVVIHYDPWWNLAVQNQATDRAHRIGQTRQVTVVKLIAAETIEEKIIKLQEAKRDLADAIIGNQSGSLVSMTKEELMELIS